MEIFKTIENLRNLSKDIIVAGKVAVAQVIEKADQRWADCLNNPDDEYPMQD